ncbi:MAG: snoRNA-binding rRNA-processing protein imp4, partial [Paramarteilia canceri]
MPELDARIESRGNGIRTLLFNITQVARAIFRHPLHLTKFLAMETGCIVLINEKENRYCITGAKNTAQLQTLVYTFIKRYVRCGHCQNFETVMEFQGTKLGKLVCSACGGSTKLSMKDRIVLFIAKNPREDLNLPSTSSKALADSDNKLADNNDMARDEDFDTFSNDFENNEAEEIYDEKILADSLANIKLETISEKTANFEKYAAPIVSGENFIQLDQNSASKIASDLTSKAVDLAIRPQAPAALAKLIFQEVLNDSYNPKVKPLLSMLSKSWQIVLFKFLENHVLSQKNFLSGLSEILTQNVSSMMTLPHLMMWLYQNSYILEESLVSWRNSMEQVEESVQFLKASKPFFDWLEEASEETDEDSDDAVNFNNKADNNNNIGHSEQRNENDQSDRTHAVSAAWNSSYFLNHLLCYLDIDIKLSNTVEPSNYLKRDIRKRKEYVYRKSIEIQNEAIAKKKKLIKEAIETGQDLPSEVRDDAIELAKQMQFDDDAADGANDHLDDEYRLAGIEDPKIVVTTSSKPSRALKQFSKEVCLIFPNSQKLNRGNADMKSLLKACTNNRVTDLVLLSETHGKPDGMIISHLPYRPTAYFTLYNVVMRHNLEEKAPGVSRSYPHLIFQNMTSKIGQRFANILKFMFPLPGLNSSRTVCFYNNNDLIHL